MGGWKKVETKLQGNQIEHLKRVLQLTSSIFETQIGESPNISEAHRIRHAGEGEIPLAAPGPSFILLGFVLLAILLVWNSFTLSSCLAYQVSDRPGEDVVLRDYNHRVELCRL